MNLLLSLLLVVLISTVNGMSLAVLTSLVFMYLFVLLHRYHHSTCVHFIFVHITSVVTHAHVF